MGINCVVKNPTKDIKLKEKGVKVFSDKAIKLWECKSKNVL